MVSDVFLRKESQFIITQHTALWSFGAEKRYQEGEFSGSGQGSWCCPPLSKAERERISRRGCVWGVARVDGADVNAWKPHGFSCWGMWSEVCLGLACLVVRMIQLRLRGQHRPRLGHGPPPPPPVFLNFRIEVLSLPEGDLHSVSLWVTLPYWGLPVKFYRHNWLR